MYIEMYFVNERFNNKALTGIVVYVSCSCALNILNICAFSLLIRQNLATFLVVQFPQKLVRLVYTCKFMFLSIRCTWCSIFSNINVPWIMIRYWPNHKDNNINISDNYKSFWKKKQNGTSRLKLLHSGFRTQCLLLCVGWGKLNIRKRR